MTGHIKWKEEQEIRKKKIAEASTAIVELLKTKSLTFCEIEDVLETVKDYIESKIIVD